MMTYDEFIDEFETELYKVFGQSKQLSPYKTGNLRNNAIKIVKTSGFDSEFGFKIYVDLSKAPYAQWLDDKPKVQREHPEGWFNEIALTIVQKLMKKYSKGILTTALNTFSEDDEEGKTSISVGKGHQKNMKEFRKNNYGG